MASKRKKDSVESSSERKRAKMSTPQLTCCLKKCSSLVQTNTERHVEVKAGIPEDDGFRKKSVVNWSVDGDAVFHEECWRELVKSARARKRSNETIKLSEVEKSMLKEAAKTAEWHDSREDIEREAVRVAGLIRNCTHCIAFTGAGISTSAGIGDYRGKGGKWTEMDREAATSNQDIDSSDDTSEQSVDDGVAYEQLRPTYTHEALVKLVEMGLLKHIISQNGDGLHGLSGIPPDHLSELHGNVFVELCEVCGHRYTRLHYTLDDEASQYYEELQDYGATEVKKPKHAMQCHQCGLNHRTGRRCEQKHCRGYLKDSIINFGDDLEEWILRRSEEHAEKTDLCLSLGTTMQVTPACDLVTRGKKPLRLVIVNRQKTGFDGLCSVKGRDGKQIGSRVFGDCDLLMRGVMAALLTEEERDAWEGKQQQRMKHYNKLRS